MDLVYQETTTLVNNVNLNTSAIEALENATNPGLWSSNGSLIYTLSNVSIGSSNNQAGIDLSGKTDALILPTGTTAERPSVPVDGIIRYNTTLQKFESYSNSTWDTLGGVNEVIGVGPTNFTNIYNPLYGKIYLDANQSLTASTWTQIVLGGLGTTVEFGTPQGNYNFVTGEFTIAVEGVYHLTTSCTFLGAKLNEDIACRIIKDSVTLAQSDLIVAKSGIENKTEISDLFYLSVGEVIKLEVFTDGSAVTLLGSPTDATLTHFSLVALIATNVVGTSNIYLQYDINDLQPNSNIPVFANYSNELVDSGYSLTTVIGDINSNQDNILNLTNDVLNLNNGISNNDIDILNIANDVLNLNSGISNNDIDILNIANDVLNLNNGISNNDIDILNIENDVLNLNSGISNNDIDILNIANDVLNLNSGISNNDIDILNIANDVLNLNNGYSNNSNLITGTDAFLLPGGTTLERPIGVDGMLRYNSTLTVFEGYSNANWGAIAGSSGGGGGTSDLDGLTLTATKTSAYTATAWEEVLCDVSGGTSFDISLPASPTVGDQVRIVLISEHSTANVYIDRNGSNWIGSTDTDIEDKYMLCLNGDNVTVKYVGGSTGWMVTVDGIKPHICILKKTVSQSIPFNTTTKVNWDSVSVDLGGLADLANEYIVIRRKGYYLLNGSINMNYSTNIGYLIYAGVPASVALIGRNYIGRYGSVPNNFVSGQINSIYEFSPGNESLLSINHQTSAINCINGDFKIAEIR